jgi:hypothetical protein
MRRWAVYLIGWVGSIIVLYVIWFAVIVMSGGAFDECDRGDCGTLGEWWYAHPDPVLAAVVVLGAGGGLLAVRSFDRRRTR